MEAIDTQDQPIVAAVDNEPFPILREVPKVVIDRNTLRLPLSLSKHASLHRYLASVDLIQKRALVQHLQTCHVDLVERDSLGGVDIILDPGTAVLYFSLAALPALCDAFKGQLEALSWRYTDILVVFEAFPVSNYLRRKASDELALHTFTPPILKALKRLRRDLGIAEVYQQKRSSTVIHYAFPLAVEEAAIYLRMFADWVEQRSGVGPWDERDWLDDEQEVCPCVSTLNDRHDTAYLHLTGREEFGRSGRS